MYPTHKNQLKFKDSFWSFWKLQPKPINPKFPKWIPKNRQLQLVPPDSKLSARSMENAGAQGMERVDHGTRERLVLESRHAPTVIEITVAAAAAPRRGLTPTLAATTQSHPFSFAFAGRIDSRLNFAARLRPFFEPDSGGCIYSDGCMECRRSDCRVCCPRYL